MDLTLLTRLVLLPALLFGLISCGSNPPQKTIIGDHTGMPTALADPEELELIQKADRLHQEFKQKGLIYRDNQLSEYLEQLAKKNLAPAIGPKLEFFVYRDPSPNAFALPNGNIYLNLGLLNKLEFESQLIFVMAHEAAHITNKHSYKGLVSRQKTIVGAHIADLILFGTGISYISAITDIASYSRELELEADEKALDVVGNSQYSLASAIRVFEQLKEVKHENQTGSIWSSHPDNMERHDHAQAYVQKNDLSLKNTILASENFDFFRRIVSENTIKMRLLQRQYQLAQETSEEAISRYGEDAKLLAYVGESYRLRAQNLRSAAREYSWLYDIKQIKAEEILETKKTIFLADARHAYIRALEVNPEEPLALRGMGLFLASQNNSPQAREYLRKYLGNQNIDDRLYIESVIRNLETQE